MLKRFALLLIAALVILPSLTGCGYNQIQKNEEAVFAAWADVEATYQRRADLIPNLVETVKAYAAHEKDTLLAVTEARASVGKTQINPGDLWRSRSHGKVPAGAGGLVRSSFPVAGGRRTLPGSEGKSEFSRSAAST